MMSDAALSLVLGALGSLFFIASCFSVVRRRVLLLGLISSALLIGSYFAKDDFSTSLLVFVALARNGLYLATGSSVVGRRLVWAALSVGAVIGWMLTVGDNAPWIAVIPLVGALIMLAAFNVRSMVILKLLTVVNGCLWLSYEWMTGAYTVMVGEVVGLMMAGIALWRLTRQLRAAQA